MKPIILICLLTGLNPVYAATINNFTSIYDNKNWLLSFENNGLIKALSAPSEKTLPNKKHINDDVINLKEEGKVTSSIDPASSDPIPTLFWLLASGILGLLGMKGMRGIKPKAEII